MAGVVVWFTGLPGSGKSTLARRLRARLGDAAVVLDGDDVRRVLVPAPGYDAEARASFYATLGCLAALLAGQGHLVLVAATAPLRAHREAARGAAPRFLEVHVATPLAECERRDPRGLYARARAGQAPELPGLGAPYEPPAAPAVVASGGDDEAALDSLARLLGQPGPPA